MKHGPKIILLKLLTILLSGSPYQWWTRQQVTAGPIHQQSQLKKSTLHVRRPFRATNVLTVELVGINQFQMFATVSIKKLHGLTSRKCNTRQRSLGSLPVNGALNSDQVISDGTATAPTKRAPGPGHKLRYTPTGILLGVDLGDKPQASSKRTEGSSPQAKGSSFKP